MTQNPPTLYQQTLNPPNGFQSVFNLATGPAGYTGGGIKANGLPSPISISSNGTFPLPNGINVHLRPSEITLPEFYEYNITLQRQLSKRFAVSGGYVGNMNRHGFLGTGQSVNINQQAYFPGVATGNANYPYYSRYGWTQGLQYYCDCSNENYNSFQATAKLNNLAGLTVQGSYTYQRQYGAGWDPYNSSYYFLYDRSAGNGTATSFRASSTFSRRIMMCLTATDGGSGPTATGLSIPPSAAGQWPESPRSTVASPTLRPPSAATPTSRTQAPTVVPIWALAQFMRPNKNRNQWTVQCPNGNCTSGAFLNPGSFAFGNYPINTLYGPIFIQQDLSLAKTFRITERLGFTLKADATNSLNHTNLGMPNNNVQTSVGQITSLAAGGTMRRMQFSGTLSFDLF